MKDINKINCYCGQVGNQKMNMLYCVKCKRWLHEECVKCLQVPMLLGDRFYILICSVCNAGSECLARIELTWADVIHLVLYNLSVIHKKKYFDLDSSILPFIVDNWERFHLFGPITSVKNEERRDKVLEVLLGDNKRFKSGREIKKSKNIFSLRQRMPPESPAVEPSAAKVKNEVVVWEFEVKERPYKMLTSTKPKGNKDSAKNGKSKKKLVTTQSRSKQPNEVFKCHGGLPYNENGIPKANNRQKRSTVTTFSEESARQGLLDSLIPSPSHFSCENNPFLKSNKGNASAKRTQSLDRKVAAPQPMKRRYNGEHVIPNGNHKLLNSGKATPACSTPRNDSDSEMFFDAKDYFSHDTHTAKEDGVCIIGKRVTSTGKIQYLFQRNR